MSTLQISANLLRPTCLDYGKKLGYRIILVIRSGVCLRLLIKSESFHRVEQPACEVEDMLETHNCLRRFIGRNIGHLVIEDD